MRESIFIGEGRIAALPPRAQAARPRTRAGHRRRGRDLALVLLPAAVAFAAPLLSNPQWRGWVIAAGTAWVAAALLIVLAAQLVHALAGAPLSRRSRAVRDIRGATGRPRI